MSCSGLVTCHPSLFCQTQSGLPSLLCEGGLVLWGKVFYVVETYSQIIIKPILTVSYIFWFVSDNRCTCIQIGVWPKQYNMFHWHSLSHSGSCFSTGAQQGEPWWSLEMKDMNTVEQVIVYPRLDEATSARARIHGAEVRVSSSF